MKPIEEQLKQDATEFQQPPLPEIHDKVMARISNSATPLQANKFNWMIPTGAIIMMALLAIVIFEPFETNIQPQNSPFDPPQIIAQNRLELNDMLSQFDKLVSEDIDNEYAQILQDVEYLESLVSEL